MPLETQLDLLLKADKEMRRVKGVTLTETDLQFRKSIRGSRRALDRESISGK